MKRKNFAMRIAALLFILTMISTCAFATTFAKYVTDGSAEDTARVAKWGVTVEATDADELFAVDYDGTVTSNTTEDVLAPGTSGSLAGFTITGSPEVDVKVTYAATLTLTGWDINGNEAGEYCPIVFTIKRSGEAIAVINGDASMSMTDLKAAVEEKIAAVSATYEANSSLSDVLSVEWAWAYEGANGSAQTDVKDTALGDLAVAPTITLKVTCTVTQID